MLQSSFAYLHLIQCSDLRRGWFDSLRICRTVLALVRNVYGGSRSLLSKYNQGHLIPTAWRVVSTSRLQVEETQMIYSRCQCITPVSRLSAPCEWWGAQRSQFAWEDVLGVDILGSWMTIQGVANQYNIMIICNKGQGVAMRRHHDHKLLSLQARSIITDFGNKKTEPDEQRQFPFIMATTTQQWHRQLDISLADHYDDKWTWQQKEDL